MQNVRVGVVRYLNVAPLIDGLDHARDLELVPAVPARIGELLAARDVDLGLISVADLIRSNGSLAALPVGMIGCDGPTLTVRLFSAVEPGSITRLHADTDSRTSVLLARLVLRERFNTRPALADFHAREAIGPGEPAADSPEEAWPEAVVLIGDKVVVSSPPAVRYPHQLDLGEAWQQITGLPFIYAIWACRSEDLNDDARRATIASAAMLLDRQRRRNLLRLDDLITRHARGAGWPMDLARRYLGGLLRYEPDERAIEGLRTFARRLAEAELVPADAPERLRVINIDDLIGLDRSAHAVPASSAAERPTEPT